MHWQDFQSGLFKRSLTQDRFNKSLDLQVSSLVGSFKKMNAFLIYSIYFHKTFYNKWCLDKTIGQIESGFERGFVKHWLNCV